MELAIALIWTLRIVLPIILFCIYFKLQSPKEELRPGPSGHVYARGELLAHRRAASLGGPPPASLQDLSLKDQAQAPSLFAAKPGRPARPAGGRREAAGPPRERREKRDGGRRAERPHEGPDEAAPSTSEDKMHLESLLNYVAFNRKEQQRTFLPNEDVAPPPPPPKKPKPDPIMAESVRAESQMVLRGAVDFKRADIAKNVYAQLVNLQVEIPGQTFALMIEACVLARDLKSASDFLMKMETSGFSPDSELLDKVMDLYSEKKIQREQEPTVPPLSAPLPVSGQLVSHAPVVLPNQEGMLAEALGPRSKLSSSAPVFVPSFGIPPPPPKPPTVEGGIAGEGALRPREARWAPAALAAFGPGVALPAAAAAADAHTAFVAHSLEIPRTKLVASAKPFEPLQWQRQEGPVAGQGVGLEHTPRRRRSSHEVSLGPRTSAWKPKLVDG